nr:hypothetical protein [Mycoplasmopsis bovis]
MHNSHYFLAEINGNKSTIPNQSSSAIIPNVNAPKISNVRIVKPIILPTGLLFAGFDSAVFISFLASSFSLFLHR